MLDDYFYVLATDAACATALATMNGIREERDHEVRVEVFQGSTFYAPRKYLHRFARHQDPALNRFGRELCHEEIQLEREHGAIVLQSKPKIEPVEGETVKYNGEDDKE